MGHEQRVATRNDLRAKQACKNFIFSCQALYRFALLVPQRTIACSQTSAMFTNNTVMFYSITSPSQFDLVCKRGSFGFISTSVIFLGFFIGSICVSTISDKFGRKYPLFICGLLCSIFNFASVFAPAFWVFAIFRGIIGFMQGKFMFRIYKSGS